MYRRPLITLERITVLHLSVSAAGSNHPLNVLLLIAGISSDIAPVNYLFNAPPVPSVAHGTTIIASSDTSFHVYRDSLTRQIIARTPQVDDVLSTVEKHVTSVREDFNATQQESEVTRQVPLPYACANAHVNFSLCSSRAFTVQLADDYSHDAAALSSSLVRTLDDQLKELGSDSGKRYEFCP